MPRMSELQTIIDRFTAQLTAVIEAQALDQARSTVVAALGGVGAPKRRGRPSKAFKLAATVAPPRKARKKGPKQLCPVPGCKNPAAPVFGMVCAKHKDLPKAKIKKFREARKAKKLGIKVRKAPKRRAKKAGLAKPVAGAQSAAAAAA